MEKRGDGPRTGEAWSVGSAPCDAGAGAKDCRPFGGPGTHITLFVINEIRKTVTMAQNGASYGLRTWIQGGLIPMDRRNAETIGVRRTGWAALDRDPQQDKVEFLCPHCGARDQKNARRERSLYHFTDGFLQDLQGEVTVCHSC